jgi:hypothetical protein
VEEPAVWGQEQGAWSKKQEVRSKRITSGIGWTTLFFWKIQFFRGSFFIVVSG